MPEILFSCHCGLMLKVHDDDQAGSEITCPACDASVIVPSVGASKVTPPGPVEDVPVRGHGIAFMILFLSATALVTLGLIKYLFLPALERPTEVARADPTPRPARPAEHDAGGDIAAEEAAERKAPARKTRAKGLMPRKVAERDGVRPSPGDPEPEVTPVPGPGGVDPERSAAKAEPSTKATTPLAGAEASSAPKTPDRSPYAHVANGAAKKQLEFALAILKRRDPRVIPTAENHLSAAEKDAKGDPIVQIEVRKLRDRIAAMRGRGR